MKDVIEEVCVKCGKEIHEREGRYRFISGTMCEECGDKNSGYKEFFL